MLSNWFKATKLSLNISKTNFMIFDKFKRMCMQNNAIIRVERCTFLGVIIDERMSWKPPHILSITSTVARNLGVMKRARSKIDARTILLLYDTLILPHLNYCNIIWASSSKSQLCKIYRLQKRAIRLVFRANKFTHSRMPLCYINCPV